MQIRNRRIGEAMDILSPPTNFPDATLAHPLFQDPCWQGRPTQEDLGRRVVTEQGTSSLSQLPTQASGCSAGSDKNMAPGLRWWRCRLQLFFFPRTDLGPYWAHCFSSIGGRCFMPLLPNLTQRHDVSQTHSLPASQEIFSQSVTYTRIFSPT